MSDEDEYVVVGQDLETLRRRVQWSEYSPRVDDVRALLRTVDYWIARHDSADSEVSRRREEAVDYRLRIEELEAALLKYGDHKKGCAVSWHMRTVPAGTEYPPCSCGYRDLVPFTPPEEPKP